MTKESKGHNTNQTPEYHDYHQEVISRRSRKEQVSGKKSRATLLCKGLGLVNCFLNTAAGLLFLEFTQGFSG